MCSTARKLSTFCTILSALNIAGLVMLGLLSISANLPFYLLFTCCIYAVSTTAIAFLLTLAVRSMVQDANFDSEATAVRIKKLNDRIAELEKILK